MGKNPVVAVIAVIVLIVAVVLIIKGMTGSDVGPGGDSTWYDTGSGKLYSGPKGVLPPAPAPSGSDGVSAAVFARGSCDNKADRFIAYLTKYTEEGKTQLKAAQAETPVKIEKMKAITSEHRLIKREKDTQWVAVGTEEGEAIMAETRQKGVRMCPEHLEWSAAVGSVQR